MKKLKITLRFSFLLFLFLYRFYSPIKTSISENTAEISGIVVEIKDIKLGLRYIVKGREKILMNDYHKLSPNIKLGDYISINGKVNKPSENTVFNLFNYQKYLSSKQIYWVMNAEKIKLISKNRNIMFGIKNNLIDRMNNIDNEYINILLFGENNLDDKIYQSYKTNGISHLFAVSGMHITTLAMLILFCLNKIIKRKNINYFIVCFLLLFYMFLVGFTASVIRSVLLFILLTIKNIFKLKIKTIYLLLGICIALLIYNPFYIYDIGFKFSFIISFYLLFFSDIINRNKNNFCKLFLTSYIAFLASIPILINNFFTVNLLTIFINMLFIPLITIIYFPLAIITFILPIFNSSFVYLISILEQTSLFISKMSINIDLQYVGIAGSIIYYLIITYILILLKNKSKKEIYLLVALIVIHYNLNYFNKNYSLTMLDVGQGDSFLITLPYNKGNILIDTGGNFNYDVSEKVIVPYLKSVGVKQIDYLFLTHGDFDHMGSSLSLVKNFKVKNVYMNSYENNALEKKLIQALILRKIRYLNVNKEAINIKGNDFYLINGMSKEENEDSLVIYVKLNEYRLLFMGDAPIKVEEEIINTYDLTNIDFLKIGHHGSKTSTSKDFINTTNPKYSLISVGKNNLYSHPSEVVLDILEDKSRLFLTDVDGSVKFIFNNQLKIKTCLKTVN